MNAGPNQSGNPSGRPQVTSRNPLRRLYIWVLSWADHPAGERILVALGVAESSVFPIPPDPLLMALCLGRPSRSLRFAAFLSAASVVGGIIGYGIGRFLWDRWGPWFLANIPGLTQARFDSVGHLYNTYDFWAVFAAGFSPLPYKVFTIAGGVFEINFPVFVAASLLSRSARFFLVAYLLKKFGAPIQAFIDKHLGWLSLLFVLLLFGGFLLFG